MDHYEKLNRLFRQQLAEYSPSASNEPQQLYLPIHYILSLGGKRLRPLLALIACDLFDQNPEMAKHAAIAVELFHNFSLVHDDIMDKAPMRRGQTTVHEKWNTNIAILSGDAILVKAYDEIAKCNTAHIPALLQILNKTAIEVCEGQQFDMDYEQTNKVNVADYLNMITLKTAVLLGCSLQMGAIIANAAQEDINELYAFGKNIGIAFQLQDDLLDIYGDTSKFGKLKGGDILANKKTFMLLTALQNANTTQNEQLNFWLTAKDFDPDKKTRAIIEIYDALNIKKLVQKEMKQYFDEALSHLKKVNCSENKKNMLIAYATELMTRES